jgi:hypothetical protein
VFRSGVLPDRAELHWIIWYPPQEDDGDVIAEIERSSRRLPDRPVALRAPAAVRVADALSGMTTDWEHRRSQAMAMAWEQVTDERVPAPSHAYPVNFGAAMEGTWLQREGIPSIVFGPGDLKVAHSRSTSCWTSVPRRRASCVPIGGAASLGRLSRRTRWGTGSDRLVDHHLPYSLGGSRLAQAGSGTWRSGREGFLERSAGPARRGRLPSCSPRTGSCVSMSGRAAAPGDRQAAADERARAGKGSGSPS